MRSYSSLGYLRINLWHRLMEAIHTAIWTINCISGPRDYAPANGRSIAFKSPGFRSLACTYLFPRLWRGPGQCGLSSLQKMELGREQVRRMHNEAQFSKCQAKSAAAHYIGCWQRFSLLYSSATQLLSDSFVGVLRPKRKGLRFSALWCLAN